jgi:hypothetical protein
MKVPFYESGYHFQKKKKKKEDQIPGTMIFVIDNQWICLEMVISWCCIVVLASTTLSNSHL